MNRILEDATRFNNQLAYNRQQNRKRAYLEMKETKKETWLQPFTTYLESTPLSPLFIHYHDNVQPIHQNHAKKREVKKFKKWQKDLRSFNLRAK